MLPNGTLAVKDNSRIIGNPVLDSLDGETRAPLRTLLALTEADRTAFGVYLVDTTPPEGKQWTGTFADDGGEPVAVFEDLPPPNAGDVNRERDRRLAAGVTVNVTGYGDIPVQGGPGDQINMLALGATAQELIDAGVTAAVVPFRDAVNTMHDLTPEQVAEMVRKAKEAASAIYATSWDMKDGTGDFTGGIPADFTADTHWP